MELSSSTVEDSALPANKQIVLRFIELAMANRIEESLALLTSDATWWVSGPARSLKVAGVKNRQQIERLLSSVRRLVPDGLQLTINGVTAEGNRVAVEVTGEGITAGGKRYANAYHFLFELRNGAIGAVREYMDTLHLYEVLRD